MQPALIRTYEFLDYHSFDCPPARDRALSEVARAYEAAFYTYNYRYLNRVVVISGRGYYRQARRGFQPPGDLPPGGGLRRDVEEHPGPPAGEPRREPGGPGPD